MHRNQFLSYIENPKHAPWHTDVFSPLLAQFPYCQSLHLMYAKHLHYIEHFNYQQQLKLTAAYAGNRSVLHALINDPTYQSVTTSSVMAVEQENNAASNVFTEAPKHHSNVFVLDELETTTATTNNNTAQSIAAANATTQWSDTNNLQPTDLPANDNLFNLEETVEEIQATVLEETTKDELDSLTHLKLHNLNKNATTSDNDSAVEVDLKNEIADEIIVPSDAVKVEYSNQNKTSAITLEAETNAESTEVLTVSENIEKEAATILNDVETNVDDINKDVNSDIHPQHLHDIIEARLAELAPSETSANKTETIEVAAKIESDISTEQQNQIEDVSVETSSTTINFHSKDVETEAEFLETDVTATDAQAETNLATHPIYLIETASVADIMLADLKEENVNKISDGTENLTTQNASEKHTFSQWLKQLTKDAQVAEVHANEPLAPFKTNINSSTVIIESTNNNPADSSIHSNSEPKPDSHNSINHLIDKFIDEQPRIEPQKSNFYSPSVAARNSVIFNDSVVSETLALIFEKQQLYQKAINAYEKLSLMFPEKSDLFAARISVLKQKKGNSH